MSEITVAPPVPGLFIVEDAVWKIKADGRIVNRVTGELHPEQNRSGCGAPLDARRKKFHAVCVSSFPLNYD